MTDDVTFPPDTINAGDTTDPNTGATVSGDGSNIVFPDQNLNPQPLPPDMPTFPTPDVPDKNPWDEYNPDPSKDPIFGPGGAGPDPQGLDPMPQDPGLNPQPLPPGMPPDMPTFPTPDVAPSPWDTPTPDPANDPIFGPSGAGPDPQGPDF
jgi:hypothetical protein